MDPRMQRVVEQIKAGRIPAQQEGEHLFAVVSLSTEKRLLILGGQHPGRGFEGEIVDVQGVQVFSGALSAANARALMARFPYTVPIPHRGQPFTLGLGDRLGLASGGHLAAIRGRGVFPVLAQQSMRELNLTGRNYEDVLAAAAFAVFAARYTNGYGADGDHLKTQTEIATALRCGYTMITLDCSEHIDHAAATQSAAEVLARYRALPDDVRTHYEQVYLDHNVPVAGGDRIDAERLARVVLLYDRAIRHTIDVYHQQIAPAGRPIDFEMSIDETHTATDPAAHYVVARELLAAGVVVTSLAPRFCGEFQKGIDYIGDQQRFASEFEQHAQIAAHLGYKISVHSGSDKFSIFPAIGRLTAGRVHVKTAGTSWLEALRVIAMQAPSLYRDLHTYALAHVEQAKKYYQIGTSHATIPPLAEVADAALPSYLDRDDARQALHITYGLLLQATTVTGKDRFRTQIYDCLHRHADMYMSVLANHIGKHLDRLGR